MKYHQISILLFIDIEGLVPEKFNYGLGISNYEECLANPSSFVPRNYNLYCKPK